MLPTLLITTPQRKAQGRLQGQEKVVSEKINLFSWHLAAHSVLSHVEGNCSCHSTLTSGGLLLCLASRFRIFWSQPAFPNAVKFITNHRYVCPAGIFDPQLLYPFCSLRSLVTMSYGSCILHIVQSSLAVQHIMESSQESSLVEK